MQTISFPSSRRAIGGSEAHAEKGAPMEEHQLEHAGQPGYDLFRRAIVDRDEDAWAESVVQYRPLLIAWANSCSARIPIDERSDDIADQALARAWAALSPNHFAAFPNLASLLGYLRACVSATVIDCARSMRARRRVILKLEAAPVAMPEQIILERMEHEEFWRTIEHLVETAQERTILVESFVLNLPPRVIQKRHPDRFADVAAIYKIKRNLLARLQRDRNLQQWYSDALFV